MIENSERSQTTSGTHPAFAFGVSVINFGLSAESRQLGLPTGCESDLWHSRRWFTYGENSPFGQGTRKHSRVNSEA